MPAQLGKNHAYDSEATIRLWLNQTSRLPARSTRGLTVPSAHHAPPPRLPCSPLSGHTNSAVPYRRTLAGGND